MTWIDFHSHKNLSEDNVTRVYSLSEADLQTDDFDLKCDAFTVGFHPWWIQNDININKQKILSLLKHKNCLGLGEIGLDRAIQTPFAKQKAIFEQYLNVAQKNNVNLLVLHCVRAYSDILEILKIKKLKQKIIFHDFNGNADIVKRLLKWDCYFSIGAKIFNEKTKIAKILKDIPVEKLFFETDDQNQFSIQKIYEKAAYCLDISLENLRKIVYESYKNLK